MIAFARRASAILFSLLRSRRNRRPFLLPANVCPIVPETFRAADLPFEAIDITEPRLEIDRLQCIERAGTHRYGGLLFVRPYGSAHTPDPFFAELRAVDPDLLIVDDQCLCPPDCEGASLSALADVTLFSTGRAKFADLGGGGFAHLRDDSGFELAPGGPSWLDLRPPDLSWTEYRERASAATSIASTHKARLNAIYANVIPEEVHLPEDLQRWRFNVLVQDSTTLVDTLFANGLFASRHYPPLGEHPVAARVHSRIVNLFNDRYFTAEQARRAAEIVVEHLASGP